MTRVGVLLAAAGDAPPSDPSRLDPREVDALAALAAVPKRRDEWLLGRWTARWAGRAWFGGDVDGWAVLAAEDGAPEAWVGGRRAECALSISHRGGLAACAVGPPHLLLGCDVELVEPRSDGFVEDFLTEREAAAVRAHPNRYLAANLVWSAKEAVLKARRTGLRADTRSVEVVELAVPDDSAGRAGSAAGWSRFEAVDDRSTRWLGWWTRVREGAVLTVVSRPFADEPFHLDPAPQSVVAPPEEGAAGPAAAPEATSASTSSP